MEGIVRLRRDGTQAGGLALNIRLLVTGLRGFVGGHVAEAIEAGVFGDATLLSLPDGLDLRDRQATERVIASMAPDHVLHLAGQSFVPRSIQSPAETYEVNVVGTVNLVQALALGGFSGRFLYVSSGDVYGRVEERNLPVDCSTPARPMNPYAASKIAAEEYCLQEWRRTGLNLVIARPFNHIGPRQDARFVVASFAQQLRQIANGEREPVLNVGDIDTTRDFTDVRDVVRAYAALLERGDAGSRYIVASGVERSPRQLLELMITLIGLDVRIEQDPSRMRASEQRRMVADASKTTHACGWVPSISIETTLEDILKTVSY
ncbi:GDP-mannose 4,6-dehydratase [Xanthomonas campestris pv. phormiicola]|nr:GDP-mannose 4,6-dehydratase [Xanthomonas campestris pv. phormiicola]UYC17039.1 GDP-mannose 4,6-dehydratase [Xanthomonas campestris pv. phormiicola]